MQAFAGPPESRLLGDSLRGDVGREGQCDDLVEFEFTGEVGGGEGGLGRHPLTVKARLDAPGQLDRRLALDRGPGDSAAADELAAVPLDQDPGAEAVLFPVTAVVE